MPFRAKGIPTGLQIENYEEEQNPNMHSPGDRIININMDYWFEQIKATTAIVGILGGILTIEN